MGGQIVPDCHFWENGVGKLSPTHHFLKGGVVKLYPSHHFQENGMDQLSPACHFLEGRVWNHPLFVLLEILHIAVCYTYRDIDMWWVECSPSVDSRTQGTGIPLGHFFLLTSFQIQLIRLMTWKWGHVNGHRLSDNPEQGDSQLHSRHWLVIDTQPAKGTMVPFTSPPVTGILGILPWDWDGCPCHLLGLVRAIEPGAVLHLLCLRHYTIPPILLQQGRQERSWRRGRAKLTLGT